MNSRSSTGAKPPVIMRAITKASTTATRTAARPKPIINSFAVDAVLEALAWFEAIWACAASFSR